jgi:hypothetical protein
MSHLGHSRRFGHWPVTFGLPQTTDIVGPGRLVRLVPQQDIFTAARAKFSQSRGRPVTMTAVALQPFSRSPAGSGGRAAVSGDVGS